MRKVSYCESACDIFFIIITQLVAWCCCLCSQFDFDLLLLLRLNYSGSTTTQSVLILIMCSRRANVLYADTQNNCKMCLHCSKCANRLFLIQHYCVPIWVCDIWLLKWLIYHLLRMNSVGAYVPAFIVIVQCCICFANYIRN